MPSAPAYIKTLQEWETWIPATVGTLFWQRAKNDRGTSWVLGMQAALKSGSTSWQGIETAYIFRLVPVTVAQGSGPGVTVISGGQVTTVGQTYETAAPKDWKEANFYYATELAARAPMELVNKTAQQFFIRTDIAEPDVRAAVALAWSDTATSTGKLVPELIAEQEAQAQGVAGAGGLFKPRRRRGFIFRPAVRPRQRVRGAGIIGELITIGLFTEKYGIAKLASNPLEWARTVFVTAPGKALQVIGREILRARENTPWLGKFFLDPLLITGLGATLHELGDVLVAGSFTAWDPRAVAGGWAVSLKAGGAVLAAVAPFLPPPWNVVCAAIAAAMIAAGTVIANQLAREQYAKQQAAKAKTAEQIRAEAQAEADRLAMEAAAMTADAGAGELLLGAEVAPQSVLPSWALPAAAAVAVVGIIGGLLAARA